MNNDIPSSEKKFISPHHKTDQKPSPSKSGDKDDIIEMSDAIDSTHWEYLLGELVHLIGLFIVKSLNNNGKRTTEVIFDQLVRHLEILNRMPEHDGCVLIRRTHCKVPTPPLDRDYFATFGNLTVRVKSDTTPTKEYTKKKSDHLQGALKQAFNCFSDQGIHSLSIQLPGDSPKKTDQLRLALNIVARFKMAVDDNSSIRFRCYGRALTFSIIHDTGGHPDVNLTLTAALNGLSPVNARELIKQAEAFHMLKISETRQADNQESVSSYNQIFSARSLRSQIVRPPVEVNNIPWLEVDCEEGDGLNLKSSQSTQASSDKSEPMDTNIDTEADTPPPKSPVTEREEDSPEKLRQLISNYIDIDDDTHVVAMMALTADDYGQVEPAAIGERLISLTRLLYRLDRKCHDPQVIERVIDFYRHRLRRIQDDVLSSIITQRQGLKIVSQGRALIVGLVHPRLFDLISLVSEHVAAQRRAATIKKIAFNFDVSHVADLAVAFGLSEKEGHHILGILKDCFSVRGSFIRPTFEGRIDLMTEFGNAIFEILWCFLKETPRRQDRLDFLNALQLLMAKLGNPKRATQYLLSDICQSPDEAGFTDRNAFSLTNILLQQENKELYVDINRTPESVLTSRRRVNKDVSRYAVWRLEADKARMLTKLRAIHRTLEDTLSIPPGDPSPFDISFLLALEREAIIFLAIVGGFTSRIFLRELLARYGSPDSEIYQSTSIKMHLPEIMAQLQIVVRSLGRAGNAEDVENLKVLEENSKTLYKLDTHPAHKLKVKQLMNIIPQTILTLH